MVCMRPFIQVKDRKELKKKILVALALTHNIEFIAIQIAQLMPKSQNNQWWWRHVFRSFSLFLSPTHELCLGWKTVCSIGFISRLQCVFLPRFQTNLNKNHHRQSPVIEMWLNGNIQFIAFQMHIITNVDISSIIDLLFLYLFFFVFFFPSWLQLAWVGRTILISIWMVIWPTIRI